MSEFTDIFVKFSNFMYKGVGLLTPCSVPREGFLYTMVVPGGRVFAPFKSCPGGGMVSDEIDTLIKYRKDVKRTFFLTESKSPFLKLNHLDRKIDKKIARFNYELVCNASAESQTMNKSDFWKLRK